MECEADGAMETGRRRLPGRLTVTPNRCVWNRVSLGGRRGGDGQMQWSLPWRSLLVHSFT
ncbi:hypothetical protein SESBI_48897 [Sesbania bispinosa]|nr:hypothetical protein SESBI_48897 [Sesbania bispinosa]